MWFLELPWPVHAILAVVIIVAAASLVQWREGRRSRSLAELARAKGFAFEPTGTPLGEAGLAALPEFADRRERDCTNILRGTTHGIEALVFDFRYNTGTRGHRNRGTRRRRTVAALRMRDRALPTFRLCPKGLMDRIARLVGADYITIDAHPDFTARFALQGDDEAAVRSLFGPTLVAHIEQHDPRWRYVVEAKGPWLVLFRDDDRLDPEEVATLIEHAGTFGAIVHQRAPLAQRRR